MCLHLIQKVRRLDSLVVLYLMSPGVSGSHSRCDDLLYSCLLTANRTEALPRFKANENAHKHRHHGSVPSQGCSHQAALTRARGHSAGGQAGHFSGLVWGFLVGPGVGMTVVVEGTHV